MKGYEVRSTIRHGGQVEPSIGGNEENGDPVNLICEIGVICAQPNQAVSNHLPSPPQIIYFKMK
ncbi:MAG: hypothetical protein ACK4SB_11910 [Belliella pelovolcani]